jgi:peptidoglycan/xylan/chitin deacetylase (PgdA/CDA1 family)
MKIPLHKVLVSRLLCLTTFALFSITYGRAGQGGFLPLRRGLKTRTPLLTFHDVVAVRDSRALWFDCSVSELKTQLDWFQRQGAHFITLEQLYAHLTKGSALPRHAIAITFADNYEGFYLRAWPILQRRRIPVAMFVHTGYVGDQHGRPKMTWGQLRELDSSGLVTIGSQTVSHPSDLRALGPSALADEMTRSKATLETRLGHPIPYLAYPNGKFDDRCEGAARAAGYRMAFSEHLFPAELSHSILSVDRYVHTKYRQAWRDAYGR